MPVWSLPQLKSQMAPGGGQSSKDLVPELQPLWFGGEKTNIVENPHSHSMICHPGLFRAAWLLASMREKERWVHTHPPR